MKFVIPCSSGKHQSFWMYKGRRVKFVANPDKCTDSDSFLYCKPDDRISRAVHEHGGELLSYNQKAPTVTLVEPRAV